MSVSSGCAMSLPGSQMNMKREGRRILTGIFHTGLYLLFTWLYSGPGTIKKPDTRSLCVEGFSER